MSKKRIKYLKKRKKKLQKKNKLNRLEIQSGYAKPSSMFFENSKAELIKTNFWNTDMAKKGFYYLTINGGAFRLLIPQEVEHDIKEIKTGKYCIVSIGSSHNSNHPFMIELLFEDHTKTPFQLTLSAGQMDRMPAREDNGGKFKLSVWTKGCNKVLEMDAYFRFVDSIPCRKPLGKTA